MKDSPEDFAFEDFKKLLDFIIQSTLDLQENGAKSTEFTYTLPALHSHSFPHYEHLALVRYIC